ncbi:hypothetical protein NXH67_14050 [Butyrivibrio sp. DSM 10294]|uniref:hypothetical protein n=1 Tax=Butyrivibrio sp. DSM 10294 TaxID=2972457 RepID=UPI00234EAB29|nr:hypothetical protein [Butyrivibrio sp. DSM 10294]MDC7294637.1 hypothetical protein [Butyrivibrio sp. DSM 10294]
MSDVFLKKNKEGKLKKVSTLEEADFVRIPAASYKETFIKHDTEDVVQIRREEYNGYRKMLRIIRDRELQQIDKEKADTHGYTTKHVDVRNFDRSRPEITAFYITKTTPISLKIDLYTAYTLVKKDLQEFYGFMDEHFFVTSKGIKKEIKEIDLLAAFKQRIESNDDRDYYVYNSEYGRKLKEIVDGSEVISFGPIKLSSNYVQGVYEASYWAAEPI